MNNQIYHEIMKPRLGRLGLTVTVALLLVITLLLSLKLLIPSEISAQGPPFLYSISSADNFLRVIDPANGSTIAGVMISLPGEIVEAGTGLAVHPTTGELWALLRLDGQPGRQRILAKIDPTTGMVTSIGNTGDGFAGLAFDSAGTLYGVTGDGANAPETLFTLSTTDATSSPVVALGNGDDGETIAFNPDDGLLYHASGHMDAGNVIFEKIALVAPFTITDIPITSTALVSEEAQALTYWQAQSVFLWKQNHEAGPLFRVTTAGTPTLIGDLDHQAKGLAFVSAGLPPPPPTCSTVAIYGAAHSFGGPATLYGIDPTSGRASFIGPIGFNRVSGLDINASGRLYATAERADVTGTLVLITIDPCTGAGTEVGPLGGTTDVVSDLSFRNSDGMLYGYDARGSDELIRIDSLSGAATIVGATGIAGSGNGLAFSPGDTLFHVDDSEVHTMNQTTGTGTTITNTRYITPANEDPRMNALDYHPVTGILFGSLNDDEEDSYLATVDTGTGEVTIIGQTVGRLDALAVAPAADVALAKTASSGAEVGRPLTYTLMVTNIGPLTASGVVVIDKLPLQVTFGSVTPAAPTCTEAGGTITCTLNSLSVNSPVTITIVVTPTTGGTITNTASLTFTSAVFDANLNNNVAVNSVTLPRRIYLPIIQKN